MSKKLLVIYQIHIKQFKSRKELIIISKSI